LALFQDGADICTTSQSPLRYDFVGDIQWILPLTDPSLSIEDSMQGDDGSVFSIDPSHKAYIHVSGLALNCNKDKSMFELDIEHYISSMKDIKSSSSSKSSKPRAPITCYIPDSPRYKVAKPMPYNKCYVSVSGFLTDVLYVTGTTDLVNRFFIEVDNIVFLGQHSSASASTVPNTLDTPTKTPRSGKGFMNYGRKQGTTTASSTTPLPKCVPATPASAPPPPPATPAPSHTIPMTPNPPTSSQPLAGQRSSPNIPFSTPTPAPREGPSRGSKRTRKDDGGDLEYA
ncbi:hypothetical protein CPC08DRAFT_811136, partial [Agrocybe pediades]